MSKAFTKEPDDTSPEDDDAPLPPGKNYMTPTGHAQLQRELRTLLHDERPKVVETVSWAASNGDRSENGDYIYGKKRLREIDRRIRFLTKCLETAEIVDPARQQGLTQIFFGATVTYKKSDGTSHQVTLVGLDEANLAQGKISWRSPVAQALLRSRPGDKIYVQNPAGGETLHVLTVNYPMPPIK